MTTQILSPDFGSTAFPRRSFTSQAALATTLVDRKRVRFARQLTDEYIIANRRCKRGICTSDEELCNRIHRIRKQLNFEKDGIAYQTEEEKYLETLNEKLFRRFEQEMTDLQCKRAIDKLAVTAKKVEDDTFNLRMDMIRIKGLHNKTVVEMKTTQARKNLDSYSPVVFAQSLWSMATGPTRRSGGASLAA